MCGLKKRWQIIGMLTVICTLLYIKNEPDVPYRSEILQYVQQPADFTKVRLWWQRWVEQEEAIPVHYAPTYAWVIDGLEPQGDGFVVTLAELVPTLYARHSGIVYFTGFTKENGAIIRVKYDDGVDVTYGLLSEIHVLPYSVLAQHDQLATNTSNTIYVEAWRDGQPFLEDELRTWLSE